LSKKNKIKRSKIKKIKKKNIFFSPFTIRHTIIMTTDHSSPSNGRGRGRDRSNNRGRGKPQLHQ
jgi:hypothetical protein